MENIQKRPLSSTNSVPLNIEEDEINVSKILSALRRRVFLIIGITSVVATLAVLKAHSAKPVYQGSFQILTKPVTAENKVIANLPQIINAQDGVQASELVKEVDTTIKVLLSHRVLDPLIEKLQSKYPKITYEELTSHLTIKAKEANILEIEYVSPQQKQVTDVLKLVSSLYLNYSLAERQADVAQAINFVTKQRTPLERRVEYWQNKLRELRIANNLIEPGQKAQELSSRIANMEQQRIEIRVQLDQMNARYEGLQRELAQVSGEKPSNSVLSENARYQKILDLIQLVDIDIQQQSATFTDDNPKIINLKQKKANLLPLLEQEKQRVLKDFQSRIQESVARDKSMYKKVRGLNNEIKNLANISRSYNEIIRELQIASDALTQFAAKQQALEIEKAQKQQPWKLLDPKLAQVNAPEGSSSSVKKILPIGIIIGLVVGIVIALVVDKVSNIFYTTLELKDATRVPLLGVVPFKKELAGVKDKKSRAGFKQGHSTSFFEVFRLLYTNILLLSSDAPIRSLVITSVGQGDGKSTVSIQLALAAAAMGQRVLLVDANLRVPSLHHQVGLMNIQGLTDVISQDLDWQNVIERLPQEDNLFVMSAVPIPPDSIRLLASRKMQDLMDKMQANFDLVIYDTPPLLGFADAYLLAANTNGIVLVAGLGRLKRNELHQTLEEMEVSGTPILGMIANRSKDAMPGSYNYYQRQYQKNLKLEGILLEKTQNKNPLLNFSNGRKNK